MKRPVLLIAVVAALGAAASAQQIKVAKGGYVAASGQWKNDGSSPAPQEPSAKVRIECDKRIALCAVAEGADLSGDGNLFTRLDIRPEHYVILRWDSTGVVAEFNARDCVNTRLVIDFRTKSVTRTETRKGGSEDNEFCNVFSKRVTSRLVNAAT
jgi:hypothetical protein